MRGHGDWNHVCNSDNTINAATDMILVPMTTHGTMAFMRQLLSKRDSLYIGAKPDFNVLRTESANIYWIANEPSPCKLPPLIK